MRWIESLSNELLIQLGSVSLKALKCKNILLTTVANTFIGHEMMVLKKQILIRVSVNQYHTVLIVLLILW
jgi:hypothetical protein